METKDLNEVFKLAMKHKLNEDYDAALELLYKNFDEKTLEIANGLGFIFQDKKFSGFNLDKSMSYYKIAADAGNIYGQHALGSLLKEKGDIENAVLWIIKASDGGSGECSYILFHYYISKSEMFVADSYLRKAVEQNNAPAIQRYAIRNIFGFYGMANIFPGLKLYISNISNLSHYTSKLNFD